MGIYAGVIKLVTDVFRGDGSNTFHFRTTTDDPTDVHTQLQAADDALEVMYDAIDPVMADGLDESFDGQWFRVDAVGESVLTNGWSRVATGGGLTLPPQICLVMGWGTSIPGKTRRGRTFLGCIGEDALQNNGTPLETARTVVVDAGDNLISTFSGGGDGAFAIWSEKDSAAYDLTRVRVANRFGSLKTRRD